MVIPGGFKKIKMDLRYRLEWEIKRQLEKSLKKLIIPITNLSAKETAEILIDTFNSNKELVTMDLEARGRLISKAVDVLEILKQKEAIFTEEIKRHGIPIITETIKMQSREGKEVNVSRICITVTKK